MGSKLHYSGIRHIGYLREPMGRRKPDDEVEILALKLYDRFNPDYLSTINVSKQKCINMAAEMVKRKLRRHVLRHGRL
jgi:hypothetical protein